MRNLAHSLDVSLRSSTYVLGGLVIFLAASVYHGQQGLEGVTEWVLDVLGPTFLILLFGLAFVAILCWVNVGHPTARLRQTWFQIGMQAANGVATLALTYTLLGITLGISVLAEQTLSPETVHDVIREMAADFSLAFTTSVIGLPLSAFLRALLLVQQSHLQETPGADTKDAPSPGRSR